MVRQFLGNLGSALESPLGPNPSSQNDPRFGVLASLLGPMVQNRQASPIARGLSAFMLGRAGSQVQLAADKKQEATKAVVQSFMQDMQSIADSGLQGEDRKVELYKTFMKPIETLSGLGIMEPNEALNNLMQFAQKSFGDVMTGEQIFKDAQGRMRTKVLEEQFGTGVGEGLTPGTASGRALGALAGIENVSTVTQDATPAEYRKLQKEVANSGVRLDGTESYENLLNIKAERTGAKLGKDSIKNQLEARERFGRTVGMLSQFTGQLKGAYDEQGGGGLMRGLFGQGQAIAGQLTDKPMGARVEAFKGQRIETALSLVGIVTGQNRMIEGVLNKLLTTLPTGMESQAQAEQKLRQSIENAFRLTKAFEKFGLDPESLSGKPVESKKFKGREMEFIKLSNTEQRLLNNELNRSLSQSEMSEMEEVVQQVLSTPATQAATGSFGGLQVQPPQVQTPAAPNIVQQGKVLVIASTGESAYLDPAEAEIALRQGARRG